MTLKLEREILLMNQLITKVDHLRQYNGRNIEKVILNITLFYDI